MEAKAVHLYVFDTLADWEPGLAVAGINNPALQARPGAFHVRTVGLDTSPVRTIGGLTILPDLPLDELEPARSAMLILPGGSVWDEGGNGEAVEVARAFLEADVPVAAICGATAGLARGGLLDDRKHTSNAPEYLQATGYQGAALYQSAPAVTDGLLTTAGATAALQFAYEIFKQLGLYSGEVLEAWYGLFRSGDPQFFHALMQAAGAIDSAEAAASGPGA